MHWTSVLLIAAVVSTAGCGSSVTCPQTTTAVTYAEVAPIFKAKCNGCHSTVREGDKRHGAPSHSNYDSYEVASEDAHHAAETVIDGSMPYGSTISDDDACAIKNWSDQGAQP